MRESIVRKTSVIAGAGMIVVSLLDAVYPLARLTAGTPVARFNEPWLTICVGILGAALVLLDSRVAPRGKTIAAGLSLFTLVAAIASLAMPASVGGGNRLGLGVTPLLGASILASASIAVLLTTFGLRTWANVVAVVLLVVDGTVLLGAAYGGSMARHDFPVVAVSGVIETFFVSIGIIAANGLSRWPLSLFSGKSVQSILNRWLLPFIVVMVVLTDLITIRLFSTMNHALASALNTVLSLLAGMFVLSRISGIVGRGLDRSYAQLRASEDKFSRVFTSLPAGLEISTIADGRFIEVNDEFCRIYGFTRQEAIGRSGAELGMWQSQEQRAILLESSRDTGREVELAIRKKSGELGIIRTRAQRMVIDGQEVLVTSFVDVTQRVQLEAERGALQDQLRESQKMEAIGRLAGGIAHDFNNLLTVIIGSGQLAAMSLDTDAPERQDVDEMVRAAERAAELTRQLLAFSRRQTIAPRDLELGAVVRQLERMLDRMIGDGIRLRCECDGPSVTIHADRGQIEQVIVNLVVNARDAMADGGEIMIRAMSVTIDDAFASRHVGAHAGTYERLTVTDTGAGMAPEVVARIFEPFFTTKEVGKGTGLGLAMVFGIVQQNGGFVVVTSKPGEGSSFDIYFPESSASGDREPAAGVVDAALRGDEAILVVEDNLDLRTLAKRVLEKHGYRALIAVTSDDAAAIARDHDGPIALLLVDVVMPGLTGPEVAERVRAARPGMKVLFMSGFPDEVLARHHLSVDTIDLLAKPFTPTELVRRVRELIDQAGASR